MKTVYRPFREENSVISKTFALRTKVDSLIVGVLRSALLLIAGTFIFQTAVIGQVGKLGTIFLEPKIITDEDPSTFTNLVAAGKAERRVYDRRTETWGKITGHIFTASFDDMEKQIEVFVNPEFSSADARKAGESYLRVVGQIPLVMREKLTQVVIHKGNNPFGGSAGGKLLIHTEQGDAYIKDGILAETLIHEAAHAVLDKLYATADGWKNAQKKDKNFISDYAREHPEREDVAESYLMYLAVRYRSNRISAETKRVVEKLMPNRMAFLDTLNHDVNPIVADSQDTEIGAECSNEGKLKSKESTSAAEFTITNTSNTAVSGYWIDFSGNRRNKFTIRPNETVTRQTYLTHPWMIVDANDLCVQVIVPPGSFSVP